MSYSNVTIEPYAKGCYQCFFFVSRLSPLPDAI